MAGITQMYARLRYGDHVKRFALWVTVLFRGTCKKISTEIQQRSSEASNPYMIMVGFVGLLKLLQS